MVELQEAGVRADSVLTKAEHGHVNFCFLTDPLAHGFSDHAVYQLYGVVYLMIDPRNVNPVFGGKT
jgi:hypothetical protein